MASGVTRALRQMVQLWKDLAWGMCGARAAPRRMLAGAVAALRSLLCRRFSDGPDTLGRVLDSTASDLCRAVPDRAEGLGDGLAWASFLVLCPARNEPAARRSLARARAHAQPTLSRFSALNVLL